MRNAISLLLTVTIHPYKKKFMKKARILKCRILKNSALNDKKMMDETRAKQKWSIDFLTIPCWGTTPSFVHSVFIAKCSFRQTSTKGVGWRVISRERGDMIDLSQFLCFLLRIRWRFCAQMFSCATVFDFVDESLLGGWAIYLVFLF